MDGFHSGSDTVMQAGHGKENSPPPEIFLAPPSYHNHYEAAPEEEEEEEEKQENSIFSLTTTTTTTMTENIDSLPLHRSDVDTLRKRLVQVNDLKAIKECRLLRTRQRMEHTQLQKQQSHEWWASWKQTLKQWVETWLGTAFTEVRAEAGTGRWHGVDRLLGFWEGVKGPVKLTGMVLLALVVIWTCVWVLNPFGSMRFNFNSATGNGSVNGVYPHGDFMPIRVDTAGIHISHPLPLCDLLYQRTDQSRLRDVLSETVATHAADRIREWWHKKGPPPAPVSPQEHQQQHEEAPEAFQTGNPDHHQSETWQHFMDSHAVRPSLSVRIEEPYPEALRNWQEASGPKPEELFTESTQAWLKRECLVASDIVADADIFANHLTNHGSIPIVVTDYIRAVAKPEPTSNTTPQGNHHVVIALFTPDDDDDASRPRVVEKPEPLLLPAPDVPEVVIRNVSAHDLHALMAYLASQASRVQVLQQTSRELETQIGNRIALAAAAFRHPKLDTQSKDLWQPVVRDQLIRLDRHKDPDLMALRTSALWSGLGGCVCPHHVGVPLPGAAWYEPAHPPEIAKARTRVLFYPSIDSPVTSSRAWKALQWMSSGSASSSELLESGTDQEAMISWEASDPVLGPSQEILQLPAGAAQRDWTWVEGTDYRGQKRRHRASPRSLACVVHCLHVCK